MNTLLDKLRKHGRVSAAMGPGDDNRASAACFKVAEHIEHRQDMIKDMKHDFVKVASEPLRDEHKDVWEIAVKEDSISCSNILVELTINTIFALPDGTEKVLQTLLFYRNKLSEDGDPAGD